VPNHDLNTWSRLHLHATQRITINYIFLHCVDQWWCDESVLVNYIRYILLKKSINLIYFFVSVLLLQDYFIVTETWMKVCMRCEANLIRPHNHQEAIRRRRTSYECLSLTNTKPHDGPGDSCVVHLPGGTYVSEILFVPGTADRKSSLGSAEFNEWHHKSPEFERRIAGVPHEPRVSFRAEFWRPWILGLPVDS